MDKNRRFEGANIFFKGYNVSEINYDDDFKNEEQLLKNKFKDEANDYFNIIDNIEQQKEYNQGMIRVYNF